MEFAGFIFVRFVTSCATGSKDRGSISAGLALLRGGLILELAAFMAVNRTAREVSLPHPHGRGRTG